MNIRLYKQISVMMLLLVVILGVGVFLLKEYSNQEDNSENLITDVKLISSAVNTDLVIKSGTMGTYAQGENISRFVPGPSDYYSYSTISLNEESLITLNANKNSWSFEFCMDSEVKGRFSENDTNVNYFEDKDSTFWFTEMLFSEFGNNCTPIYESDLIDGFFLVSDDLIFVFF
ncbi:MAG: hypothetical protein Q9M91_05455 [Candidatus Dojkabacteria bacterium]|nr:hypothetical protein [Candidatus Dojkabacteria bacterium]MDQ7021249.1 hypothetical protein [Candidatus Dojkabacteria bacterium]